jgi:hypothetical protein
MYASEVATILQEKYQNSLNEALTIGSMTTEAVKGTNIKINPLLQVNTTWQLSGMDLIENETTSYKDCMIFIAP